MKKAADGKSTMMAVVPFIRLCGSFWSLLGSLKEK
jgi:hypothetical protein